MGDHSEIAAGRAAEEKQLIHASQTAAHKKLSAPEPPFSLCKVTERERERERERVGLRMQSKLEYLLFRSM
jgi:hypothetical protein